jgi:hypothetical protein
MTNMAERGSSSSGERRGRGLAAIHMSHWKYVFRPSSIAVFTPTHSTQAQYVFATHHHWRLAETLPFLLPNRRHAAHQR